VGLIAGASGRRNLVGDMTGSTGTPARPYRDADGRFGTLAGLLAMSLAGLVAGAVVLALFDGVFALLGLGDFGRVNGWLAVIVPVMLLVEDFRAWRGERARLVAAPVALAVGVAAGLVAAGLAGAAPPLLSGAVGALVCTLGYAPVWFHGVRAGGRRGGSGSGGRA